MNAFEQIVSKKKVIDRITFESLPMCWLSDFIDWHDTGSIASCHIVDQCLLTDEDARKYSPSFRLKLRVDIHALWDARIITINPNGTITTLLSDEALSALGLNKKSRLPYIVLTDERIKALQERINDRDKFILAKQLAIQAKKQADAQNETINSNQNLDK